MSKGNNRSSPSLARRKSPSIEPRLKLLIFCEGKNTEPDYIEGVARAFGNRLVSIDAQRAAGVPKTLVQKALNARTKNGKPKNSFEEKDQIW